MQLPGSARQLALFRIALGLQIFYSSSSLLLNLLTVVKGTSKPTIFPQFMDDFIAGIAVPYLQISTQLLSVFLILGLFTRFILPILFISFILLFGFWYSKFDAPVPWLYLWFPLLVLSFSRSEDEYSLDKFFSFCRKSEVAVNSYRWPIEVVSGWFAYIYVAAGIAKLLPITKGLNWLDGGTSQKIIYDRFLDSILFYIVEKPLFDYSSFSWIFSLLTIGSVIIELLCFTIIFTSKHNSTIVILVITMHCFLYLVGVPGFVQITAILCLCLVDPKYFEHT